MSRSKAQTPFLSNLHTQKAVSVANHRYAWGDRLTRAGLAASGASAAEQKRYAGMVRMETSTPGGGKSSSYLNFRIMMEGSSGWIVPAKPGLYIVKDVVTDMQPKANAAFAEAIARTVKS